MWLFTLSTLTNEIAEHRCECGASRCQRGSGSQRARRVAIDRMNSSLDTRLGGKRCTRRNVTSLTISQHWDSIFIWLLVQAFAQQRARIWGMTRPGAANIELWGQRSNSSDPLGLVLGRLVTPWATFTPRNGDSVHIYPLAFQGSGSRWQW